jgi:hypothetical protein
MHVLHERTRLGLTSPGHLREFISQAGSSIWKLGTFVQGVLNLRGIPSLLGALLE